MSACRSSSIVMLTQGLHPDLWRTSVTSAGELHQLVSLPSCLDYLPAWQLVFCRTQHPTEAGRPASDAGNVHRPALTLRRAHGSYFALLQSLQQHVRSTLLQNREWACLLLCHSGSPFDLLHLYPKKLLGGSLKTMGTATVVLPQCLRDLGSLVVRFILAVTLKPATAWIAVALLCD